MPVLLTVTEVDEVLKRAIRIPEDERTDMWHNIVDSLLERRKELAGTEAQRCETR